MSDIRAGKDERRAAILKIAREVFLSDGYAAASMSQIAAKVGGSKATLYNYFPSKKDLFFAVSEAESIRLMDLLFRFNDINGDVFEGVRLFCRRLIDVVLQDDMVALYRLIVAESARFPELGQAVYETGYGPGMNRMAGLLQMAMDHGLLRKADPRKGAELLLDLCQGSLHDYRLWGVRDSVTLEEITTAADRAAAIFLTVYGNDELAAVARSLIV